MYLVVRHQNSEEYLRGLVHPPAGSPITPINSAGMRQSPRAAVHNLRPTLSNNKGRRKQPPRKVYQV